MNSPLTANKLVKRIVIAGIVLIITAVVCSFIGPNKISPSDVLLSKQDGDTGRQIYYNIRLPRILLATIVGAALASSGVVFQAMLRNPLAEPYILGVSSGAGLGVTIAILLSVGLGSYAGSATGVFAFIGAIGTVWLVWKIGRVAGRTNVTGLLLAGIVVNSFCSALIMLLTSLSSSGKAFSTLLWLMGNIREHTPIVLWMSTGIITAGIVALYYIAGQLNAISFSEEDAQSMGIDPVRTQAIGYGVTALITAIAVSLSGLIGFVGLIVPHAMRLIFGADHRQLIALSAIYGGVFLIIADTFAKVVVAPAQLPVGVVTSLLGGPFFLLLLVRITRKAEQ
jgi:iron complex transport system permease protein